jgi:UDP-glucuronate 4-epimerase
LEDTGIARTGLDSGHPIQSKIYDNYKFLKLDLTDKEGMNSLFEVEKFDVVVNLAAQAGVRYSITNPQAYLDSNIQGFLNVLECSRHNKIKHLIYASSSSVYGLNKKMPFSTHNNVDHPISLYAASKKSNELMAHTYSYLFDLPTTGLRFFTVYGPWGRPDMAIFLFTKAMIEGKPINVFNNGNMRRDFTYVDDIINGVLRVIANPAESNSHWDAEKPDPASSKIPYKVLNIGKGKPVNLLDFVEQIESSLGIIAEKNYMPLQDGDVEETWADVNPLQVEYGYEPKVEVSEGIPHFVNWYKRFYGITDETLKISGEIKG